MAARLLRAADELQLLATPARCPVCGGRKLIEHADLQECRVCSHLFQWPATITARYDDAYVAKYAAYPVTEISFVRLGFLRAYVAGGRLLDVGHGRGDFVRAARRAGFEAYGHDIHGIAVGVPTIASLNRPEPWDVVTMFDSLEHFAGLGVVAELARRATWLVVSLPVAPAGFPACRDWKHYRPGEHLHYFNTRSLLRLFDRHRLIRETDLENAIRTDIATFIFRRIDDETQ